jgi:hypothetical protein
MEFARANVPREFEPHFDYRLIASNQVPLGTIIAIATSGSWLGGMLEKVGRWGSKLTGELCARNIRQLIERNRTANGRKRCSNADLAPPSGIETRSRPGVGLLKVVRLIRRHARPPRFSGKSSANARMNGVDRGRRLITTASVSACAPSVEIKSPDLTKKRREAAQ